MSIFSSLLERLGRTQISREARRLQELAEAREIGARDREWLRALFARDPAAKAEFDRLQRWHRAARTFERPAAPGDFALRTMARARRWEDEVERNRVQDRPRWVMASVTGAVAVAVFAYAVAMRIPDPEQQGVAVSGPAGAELVRSDVVVRLPELGGAEARTVFRAAVEAQGGSVQLVDGDLSASLPADRLEGLLDALRERSAVDLSAEANDLSGRQTLRLLLEN